MTVQTFPSVQQKSGRIAAFLYGLICYVIFLVTFLYACGFVGNFLVPHSIDSAPIISWGNALLVDAALLGIFALNYSNLLHLIPFFPSDFHLYKLFLFLGLVTHESSPHHNGGSVPQIWYYALEIRIATSLFLALCSPIFSLFRGCPLLSSGLPL